jgi:hypothetical protein
VTILNSARKNEHESLTIALSVSFVLGMAVAIAVYLAWRTNPSLYSHGFLSVAALIICPPYVLALIMGPLLDSGLAMALALGTIVFANGFLYAGVAAGGHFLFMLRARKKISQ